jgi:hypothetical protein
LLFYTAHRALVNARHDGIFGIERAEWGSSQDFRELADKPHKEEMARESELVSGKADVFGIYRLKDGKETRNIRFEPFETLEAKGLAVERGNYQLVYTAPLSSNETLDTIFYTLNNQRPKDFTGYSLSTSDIVVLQTAGNISSHYVDGHGFKELPSFLGNETPFAERPAAEPAVSAPATDNNAAHSEKETFGPNVAELEAQVKAGQSISLLDLSAAIKKDKKQPEKAAKISILAHIEKSKKEAAQTAEHPKSPPKRDSKDVLGG